MKRAVLLCPGRGSYTRDELGWLRRTEPCPAARQLVALADRRRAEAGHPTVSELDGAVRFQPSVHLAGSNVSALIYTCTLADIACIDPQRFDVVAVGGNSLGWYTALAAAGALEFEEGLALCDGMGALQQELGAGGQILYPEVDDEWRPDAERAALVDERLASAAGSGAGLWRSIRFGGFAVLGGDERGMAHAEERLPAATLGKRAYPLRLAGSSAFHTPLAAPVSGRALTRLAATLPWRAPRLGLVDGRGAIWSPWSADRRALGAYTLGEQVTSTFDFAATIRVLLGEFAPDVLILPGPGDSLGAAVAQTLISLRWNGIDSRHEFLRRQDSGDAPVLSMGRPEQRGRVRSGVSGS